jgi:hypothetical protein
MFAGRFAFPEAWVKGWVKIRQTRAASALAPTVRRMERLEGIVYAAGRGALADQEGLVSGIRQRTGTLLGAHALVASFLGAATLRAHGLDFWGWVGLSALVLMIVQTVAWLTALAVT